jgi:hypothetical protein
MEHLGQVTGWQFAESSTAYKVCLTPDSFMAFVADRVTVTSWLVQVPNGYGVLPMAALAVVIGTLYATMAA